MPCTEWKALRVDRPPRIPIFSEAAATDVRREESPAGIHQRGTMAQTREERGRWYSVCFCARCHQRLSREDLTVPDGVCPHCQAQSSGPFPDYYTIRHRRVTTYRRVLGLFWVPMSTRLESRSSQVRRQG